METIYIVGNITVIIYYAYLRHKIISVIGIVRRYEKEIRYSDLIINESGIRLRITKISNNNNNNNNNLPKWLTTEKPITGKK